MGLHEIFTIQARTLVEAVQRWLEAGGLQPDDAQARPVRELVAEHLRWGDGVEIIAMALGHLNDTQAERLNALVNHCSQTFYETEATWNAFAIPIAVQWHMQRNRIYTLKRCSQPQLDLFARGIRQCLGAQQVLIDPVVYSGASLFGASTHQLYGQLSRLCGRRPFTLPLRGSPVRSSGEPYWKMVYLLGVEVTPPEAPRRLHEPGVQAALQDYLHHGVDALTKHEVDLFSQGARGHTICHAPQYLQQAIRQGEQALQGYRLRQHLEEIAKVSDELSICYALHPLGGCIKMLLKTDWLAYEMKWQLHAEESPLDAPASWAKTLRAVKPALECRWEPVGYEDWHTLRAQTHLAACLPRRAV